MSETVTNMAASINLESHNGHLDLTRQEEVFTAGGMKKILESSVLVMGTNGAACHAIRNLVLGGVGHIYLWEDDSRVSQADVDDSGVFHKSDIGQVRSTALKSRIDKFEAGTCIEIMKGKRSQVLDTANLQQAGVRIVVIADRSIHSKETSEFARRFTATSDKCDNNDDVGDNSRAVLAVDTRGLTWAVGIQLTDHTCCVDASGHDLQHELRINEVQPLPDDPYSVEVTLNCPNEEDDTLFPPPMQACTFHVVDSRGTRVTTRPVKVTKHDGEGSVLMWLRCESDQDVALLLAASKEGYLFMNLMPDSEMRSANDLSEDLLEKFRRGKVTSASQVLLALLVRDMQQDMQQDWESALDAAQKVLESKEAHSRHFSDTSVQALKKVLAVTVANAHLPLQSAVVGGIVSMEALKILSNKHVPGSIICASDFVLATNPPSDDPDWFCTQHRRLLNSSEKNACQKLFFGEDVMIALQTLAVRLIGTGAIGCEVLQNLALMGVRNIHTYDGDTIAPSNRHRQPLFGPNSVNRNKAEEAASVINAKYDINVKGIPAHFLETTLPDELSYSNLPDCLISAVDSRSVRWSLDAIAHAEGIPMIDGGTDGPSGHTFFAAPNVTASGRHEYAVPTRAINVSCLAPGSLTTTSHMVLLAKEIFDWTFCRDTTISLRMFDNASGSSLLEDDATNLKWSILDNSRSELSTDLLEILFVRAMQQLQDDATHDSPLAKLNVPHKTDLPADLVNSTRELMERGLTQQEFDKDDFTHLKFVHVASVLLARTYGIPPPTRFQVKQIGGQMQGAVLAVTTIVAASMCMNLYALAHRAVSATRQDGDKEDTSWLRRVKRHHINGAYALYHSEPVAALDSSNSEQPSYVLHSTLEELWERLCASDKTIKKWTFVLPEGNTTLCLNGNKGSMACLHRHVVATINSHPSRRYHLFRCLPTTEIDEDGDEMEVDATDLRNVRHLWKIPGCCGSNGTGQPRRRIITTIV